MKMIAHSVQITNSRCLLIRQDIERDDLLVLIVIFILSSCCAHGMERPVWSCGVFDWIGRPLNEQPVAWSDSWSQMETTWKRRLVFFETLFQIPDACWEHVAVKRVSVPLDTHKGNTTARASSAKVVWPDISGYKSSATL